LYHYSNNQFLSYYPLKQGLKHISIEGLSTPFSIFILLSIKTRIETYASIECVNHKQKFLSYYPLKQGLKQKQEKQDYINRQIFILLSIKTRIETAQNN